MIEMSAVNSQSGPAANPNSALPANTKINQVVPSLSPAQSNINQSLTPSTITTTTTTTTTTSQQNNSLTSNQPNTNTYGGFAYCSNCGEYGVKAAFYGKSKLYCSVACQNGIKKQSQTQQNQGVKRTIESLNTSNSGSVCNSPSFSNTNNNTQTATTTTTNSQPPGAQLGSSQSSSLNISVTFSNSQPSDQSASTHLIQANLPSSDNMIVNGNLAKRPRINSVSSSSSPASSSTSASSTTTPANLTTPVTQISIDPPLTTQTPTQTTKFSPKLKTSPASLVKKSPTHSRLSTHAFNWPSYIEETKSAAAPVYFFKHVPLSNFWRKIMSNVIVEVPNRATPCALNQEPSLRSGEEEVYYWFAWVVQYAGYLAKMRYFGYDNDSSHDFWIHLCDPNVHHVGWAAESGHLIVPPDPIVDQRDDWKNYLLSKIVGCKTLPSNFHKRISDSLTSRFKRGMLLELVDKKTLARMRISRIIDNIGGRLRMKYENLEDFDDFWCHQLSELIHPIGWSSTVGHEILAPDEYKKTSALKYQSNHYEANECCPDMFHKTREIHSSVSNLKPFKVGMKLEAIDPLNLSSICVATVGKVLKNNYLMIRIDGCKTEDGSDMFCYHRTSSSIFPAGFCQKNSIPLQAPYDFKGVFNWETYLKETNAEFAPAELFYADSQTQNPFKVGMKLESVDLMEPKMICVATVVAVVNRLIRLNFDGWERQYDQWVDCESCDIYPVGWCQLVNYSLEPPRPKNETGSVRKKSKKTIKKK